MKKKNIVAEDLRAARHKAGLRQIDCAHLLGVKPARIARIEAGSQLYAKEAAAFSIVYGKPMEAIAAGFLDEIVNDLAARLRSIPPLRQPTADTFNRLHTLEELGGRLAALTTTQHGAQ